MPKVKASPPKIGKSVSEFQRPRRSAAIQSQERSKQVQNVENSSDNVAIETMQKNEIKGALSMLPPEVLKSLAGDKSGTIKPTLLSKVPDQFIVKTEWGEIPKDQIKMYTCKPPTRTNGVLHFADAPRFKPNLTPEEIIKAGSFGGYYYRSIASTVTGKVHIDAYKEFPKEWFEGINVGRMVTNPIYDKSINKYGVSCGQDLREWEQQGWINPLDPFGWFQWYCRFYLGRRCQDDERQIQRWANAASDKGRWRNNLLNKIYANHGSNVSGYKDQSVSPVIRQVLLHWGYEVTEGDYRGWIK